MLKAIAIISAAVVLVFVAAFGTMVVCIFEEERYEQRRRKVIYQGQFREKSYKEIIHELLEDNTSEWNYKLMKAREKRREEIKRATKNEV